MTHERRDFDHKYAAEIRRRARIMLEHGHVSGYCKACGMYCSSPRGEEPNCIKCRVNANWEIES